MKKRMVRLGIPLILLVGLALACATTQSRYMSLSKESYTPLQENCEVEVFRTGRPARPFVKVSRLDVHLEKSGFVSSSFEEALPELKRQARLSGACAMIDIDETQSSRFELRVYHVTATGIRYSDEATKK